MSLLASLLAFIPGFMPLAKGSPSGPTSPLTVTGPISQPWTCPPYTTMSYDFRGGGGGGSSPSTQGGNGGDSYISDPLSQVNQVRGNRGQGAGTASNGVAGAASGGQNNVTGGGNAGGAPDFYQGGYTGGNGGRSYGTWTRGAAGAPVPGNGYTLIAGVGGTGGGQLLGGAPNKGSPGTITLTWS